MIFFENTEIAFAYKNKRELRKAWWLFRILQIRTLYFLWDIFINISVRFKLPVGWLVKPTFFTHFCGGTTLEESIKIVALLSRYKVRSILDYSIEGAQTAVSMQQTVDELLRGIEVPACCSNVAFAVFKPSALCNGNILELLYSSNELAPEVQNEADLFRERIEELCWKAFEKKVPILIDAETYAPQNFIDGIITEMMEKFNHEKVIVYNTVQMYRTDRLDFLNQSLERANQKGYRLGFKVVRGAYMEKERQRAEQMGYASPIWPDKESTDRAYNQALGFCIYHIDKISIVAGTHNDESCFFLTELMKKNGIENNDNRVYFSQLYGMSDHLTFNLAHEGYNVAKYVPYGPLNKVLPYLMRRAEENSSIAGQTSRELRLISAELQRRKRAK